jgi:hypothetical protein
MTSAKRVVSFGEMRRQHSKTESYRLHQAAKPCFPGLAAHRWGIDCVGDSPTEVPRQWLAPRAAVAQISKCLFSSRQPLPLEVFWLSAQFADESKNNPSLFSILHPVLSALHGSPSS